MRHTRSLYSAPLRLSWREAHTSCFPAKVLWSPVRTPKEKHPLLTTPTPRFPPYSSGGWVSRYNTGYPVKLAFQINCQEFCSISMCCATCTGLFVYLHNLAILPKRAQCLPGSSSQFERENQQLAQTTQPLAASQCALPSIIQHRQK